MTANTGAFRASTARTVRISGRASRLTEINDQLGMIEVELQRLTGLVEQNPTSEAISMLNFVESAKTVLEAELGTILQPSLRATAVSAGYRRRRLPGGAGTYVRLCESVHACMYAQKCVRMHLVRACMHVCLLAHVSHC